MPEYSINIKHAGRTYPLKVNTDAPPTDFKQAVYEATGVPVDRVKIMVKGGVLKDDHDWSKAGIKEGQTIMVIGAAGPLPKAPEKPTVFLEDMDDAELASAVGHTDNIFRAWLLTVLFSLYIYSIIN
jgi:ubiquitin carboxyl-terminal hydrolase 14